MAELQNATNLRVSMDTDSDRESKSTTRCILDPLFDDAAWLERWAISTLHVWFWFVSWRRLDRRPPPIRHWFWTGIWWEFCEDREGNAWSPSNHRHIVKCNRVHCNEPLPIHCVWFELRLFFFVCHCEVCTGNSAYRAMMDVAISRQPMGTTGWTNGSIGSSIWIYIGFWM